MTLQGLFTHLPKIMRFFISLEIDKIDTGTQAFQVFMYEIFNSKIEAVVCHLLQLEISNIDPFIYGFAASKQTAVTRQHWGCFDLL